MRVNIEHGTETTGLFKKTTYHTVTIKVDFSEEEKAIIEKAQLGDAIIMERPMPPNRHDVPGDDNYWNLKIRDLYQRKNGDTYVFRTTGEAQGYEEELKEGLQHVKSAIEAHRDVKVESKSFEL